MTEVSPGLFDGLFTGLAWLVGVAGLLLGCLVLLATGRPRPALGILLDLLLAAGLLRLSTLGTWSAIISAAALVVIRKVVVLALDNTRGLARRAAAPSVHTGKA